MQCLTVDLLGLCPFVCVMCVSVYAYVYQRDHRGYKLSLGCPQSLGWAFRGFTAYGSLKEKYHYNAL